MKGVKWSMQQVTAWTTPRLQSGAFPGDVAAPPREGAIGGAARNQENPEHSSGTFRRRRLRVLLIGHQFQVGSEGQAKACALSKFEDLDLYVLTPERYREEGSRWRYPEVPGEASFHFGVAAVSLAWGGPAKWYLQWYRNLAETLKSLRPDVVDLWEEPWSLLSAQVLFLRNTLLPGTRVISETEQNIFKNLPPPFEWFRSFTFQHADFLVGRNAESLQVARRKRFNGPSKVVGNGVDVGLFCRRDRAECRARFGMSGFCIGYAGRLVPEKGLEVLLAAFRELKKPCSLWLSGDGGMRKRLLTEPGVSWAGAVSRSELPAFYNAVDVLVLPSLTTSNWKEQFGRVIVEAQACGTPVVGSDSGAIPEVIGGKGLVFPEGDSGALADCLQKLRNNPALSSELSLAGGRHAAERYSWEAIAAEMREIYLGLAERKTRNEGQS